APHFGQVFSLHIRQLRGHEQLCQAMRLAIQRQGGRHALHLRNPKAGAAMSRRQFSPEDLRAIRELAKGWGKIIARRACGDGPLTEVDLSSMEQLAQAAAAGLTEGTLTTLLEQQAQALGPEQPCPDCGRPCPLRRSERTLACRD